jgi:hypothetical protein
MPAVFDICFLQIYIYRLFQQVKAMKGGEICCLRKVKYLCAKSEVVSFNSSFFVQSEYQFTKTKILVLKMIFEAAFKFN